MKRLLLILALLLIPASMTASAPPEHWWYCAQMGSIGKSKVVIYTEVHENNADLTTEQKEKAFAVHVKKHSEPFDPLFHPTCNEYREKRAANKELGVFLKRAKKLGFLLLEVCPFHCEKHDEVK